jgi:hypothetical protein
MFIASRGPESPQVVLSPAAPQESPSKPAPTPGEAPRVAHLDNQQPFSSQSFAVPSRVFEPQPLGQGQSLFPIPVKLRDYSFPPDIHAFAKMLSIAILEFEDYVSRLRKPRFKTKMLTELSAASDTQPDQGNPR